MTLAAAANTSRAPTAAAMERPMSGTTMSSPRSTQQGVWTDGGWGFTRA
jgi:hypothetical protein